MSTWEAGLEAKRAQVEQALGSVLEDGEVPESLAEALRRSIFPGGKRLRPICVLAVADLLGRDREQVMRLACALELVHSASLVLDDLPSMDNATERRGRPALHVQFGVATAILAAIALLSRAFELVAETARALRLPHRDAALMVAELSQAIGAEGMVAGQYLDLTATLTANDLKTIEFIHSRKTGRLFVAAFRLAAVALRADELTLEALTGFGRNLGLAFQITDDMLSLTATSEELGKRSARGSPLQQAQGAEQGRSTGSPRPERVEAREGNPVNFATLFGLEHARTLARELVATANQCLALFGERAEFLRALARYVLERRR